MGANTVSEPAPVRAANDSPGKGVLELAARGASGVLRLRRGEGRATVHLAAGSVTRVRMDGQESMSVYLVRKGLLTAGGMRAALAEVEQEEVTFGEALERLGLMDRETLGRERGSRVEEALETLVAGGGEVVELEPREASLPGVDPVPAVVRGLLRSAEARSWLEEAHDLRHELRLTPLFGSLEAALREALGQAAMPADGERAEELAGRVGEDGGRVLAALVVGGLVELHAPEREAPADLELRAASLSDMGEASRLLLDASADYESLGDSAGARRAALSALRRTPTAPEPLARVERLCLESAEVATLELVYELVSGAMPGAFGRRSTLYRAGRLFEKELGDAPRAREFYRRAFNNVPESGAVLEALERMAATLGDTAAVPEAYAAIAMASSRPEVREAWLRRAIARAEAESGAESALELLLKVHEDEPSVETERILDELAPEVPRTPVPVPAEPEPPAVLADPEELGAPAEDERGQPSAEEPDAEAAAWTSLAEAAAAAADSAASPVPADKSPFAALGDLLGAEDEPFLDDAPLPVPSKRALAAPQEPAPERDEARETTLAAESGGAEEPWPAPASRGEHASPTPAAPPVPAAAGEVRALREALARDPGDLGRLRALRAALEAAGDRAGEAAVCALMVTFDGLPDSPPLVPSEPVTEERLGALAGVSSDARLRALGLLWRAAPWLLKKDLAELGVSRALPPRESDGRTAAEAAFASARQVLGPGEVRLLHVPSGPAVRVVATSPPAILVGPAATDLPAPELRFRLARAVAMTWPDLLLACTLPPPDLGVALRAVQAAFGRSLARGSLDFASASLAQNLWTTLSPEDQQELKDLLAEASTADAEGVRTRGTAAANRLGLVATGDVSAAVRVAVADDPFLAGTDPATQEGFARAARRSEQVATLVRLAIDPAFAELSWRVAPAD